MTYAEAVKRVGFSIQDVHVLRAKAGRKDFGNAYKQDYEALAVLRRAGKVMEAVEGSNCDDMNDTITILSDFPLQAHSRDIIRRAYAYKEQSK